MYALLDEARPVDGRTSRPLQVLSDCGDELSVKEVSEQLGLSLPGASRAVDALLRRGYLDRREDEQDRRMKRCGITPDGGRDVLRRIDGARLVGLESTTRRCPGAARRLTARSPTSPHRRHDRSAPP